MGGLLRRLFSSVVHGEALTVRDREVDVVEPVAEHVRHRPGDADLAGPFFTLSVACLLSSELVPSTGAPLELLLTKPQAGSSTL